MMFFFVTGVFAYSSGCLLVVEDLNAGSQQHLSGILEILEFFPQIVLKILSIIDVYVFID